jgi:hypothetical protein
MASVFAPASVATICSPGCRSAQGSPCPRGSTDCWPRSSASPFGEDEVVALLQRTPEDRSGMALLGQGRFEQLDWVARRVVEQVVLGLYGPDQKVEDSHLREPVIAARELSLEFVKGRAVAIQVSLVAADERGGARPE